MLLDFFELVWVFQKCGRIEVFVLNCYGRIRHRGTRVDRLEKQVRFEKLQIPSFSVQGSGNAKIPNEIISALPKSGINGLIWSKVAKFLVAKHTQTGKNIPNYHKM
jgi:hypothetical protein